jgi:hypothetical protein
MSSKVFDGAVKVFATRCHWERAVTPATDVNPISLIFLLDQPHLALPAIVPSEGSTGTDKI